MKRRYVERDREIVHLHTTGMGFRAIGKRFGISRSRAQQVFLREKTLADESARGTLKGYGLSDGNIRLLARATGVENPGFIDLVNLLRRYQAEATQAGWGSWEPVFLRRPYFGRVFLRQVYEALNKAGLTIQ